MNTLHSLVYMLCICVAADVNVIGYPAWKSEDRPWIAILAKGDDQVYIGDKRHLELLKPHFSLVYELENPLYYTDGTQVKQVLYNSCLGQIAKMVSEQWDFISTYAEFRDNRIVLLTRDLERAVQFCTTTTKTISTNELANYSVDEILGVRYLIEGNLLKGICDDPYFFEIGQYLLKLADDLLSNSTDSIVRSLHTKMFTRDDFYKRLITGDQHQEGEYTFEYLTTKYPNLFHDFESLIADVHELYVQE